MDQLGRSWATTDVNQTECVVKENENNSSIQSICQREANDGSSIDVVTGTH